jgi:hypothetical protein
MTSADAANRMIRVVGVSALVMIAVGVPLYGYYEGVADGILFAVGVLMTAGCNVIRVNMLKRAVEKAVTKDSTKSAVGYIRGQFLIRYALLAAVLLAAVFIGSQAGYMGLFWGAIAGVFTMQIATYSLKSYYKQFEAPIPEPKEEVKPAKEATMTRIELIAVLRSIKALLETNNTEKALEIINEIIDDTANA